MRILSIHNNIPVSDTKLSPCLLVGFISSHLTADKLFPVHQRAIRGLPKMSIQLKAKGASALIIKPTPFLVAHTDVFGWNITSNQQEKSLYKACTGLSPNKMLHPGRSCSAPQTEIQLTLSFKKTFLLIH